MGGCIFITFRTPNREMFVVHRTLVLPKIKDGACACLNVIMEVKRRRNRTPQVNEYYENMAENIPSKKFYSENCERRRGGSSFKNRTAATQ